MLAMCNMMFAKKKCELLKALNQMNTCITMKPAGQSKKKAFGQAGDYHNQKCLATDGKHFGHFLLLQKSNMTFIHLFTHIGIYCVYYNFTTPFSFLIIFLIYNIIYISI